MEILFLLIGIPFIIGIMLGIALLTMTIIGYVIIGTLILMVRFWYLVFAIMLIMLFPVFYVNSWLSWILIPIILFGVLMWFTPVPDEQKGDVQKAKAEFRKSWNNLISKA